MNDSVESTPRLVTCRCRHCDGGIEFDANQLGEESCDIPCPHCGLETKLFIPQIEATQKESPQETEKANGRRLKILWNKDELELADDKVIIRKRGLANALASGMNGDRTIPIASLAAIQLKPGGMITLGYILFSYAGSKPFMGGLWEATQDPDAFLFGTAMNEQVSEFKAKVEEIMRDSKQSSSSSNLPATLTDELRKLAEFKQQGILSQEEFEAAKKKLLS